MQAPAQERTEVRITRMNRGFLLKEMSYQQHFSHVYVARLQQLKPRVVLAFKDFYEQQQKQQNGQQENGARASKSAMPRLARVLDVSNVKGGSTEEAFLVGTVYKNMPLFRPFLREYTAELVRLEAGDDDDDEAGGGGAGGGDGGEGGGDGDEGGGVGVGESVNDFNLQADAAANAGGAAAAGAQISANICSEKDCLVLEDDSGRIELGGAGIDAAAFVTGVVVGVTGVVNERGVFLVTRCFTATAAPPAPRKNLLTTTTTSKPCYVAFLSGLNITGLGAAPPSLELLIDFMSGNLGDAATVEMAARIGRVIIGGGLVVETEESKLTQKVKLEPSDHARLQEVSSGKNSSHSASCAGAMKHADRFVSLIARTIPVEVMPGATDPTNCFLPQQPVHPLMLPTAAKCNSLRLVTNPFAFETSLVESAAVSAGESSCSFLVSSGQNVNDLLRQAKLGEANVAVSSVTAMMRMLQWGHLAPTAPNTLPCFPFKAEDPLVISIAPHCFVTCGQPLFETRFDGGVRFVSVPRFAHTGQIVLVDVASPQLNTKVISLQLADD